MKIELEKFAAKVDRVLFNDNPDADSYNYHLFVNYFSDDYTPHLHFLKYLNREIKSSLILNAVLASINFLLMPFRLEYCWSCSPHATVWLMILSMLNMLIVWPKLLILYRIKVIMATGDNTARGFLIWALFTSNLYKMNNKISKYIFGTYALGIILVILFRNNCSDLYWSKIGLLAFFLVRLLLSFYKFNKAFSNFHNIDLLFEYLRRTNTPEKINALKLIGYKELLANNPDNKTCAICYDEYTESSIMRVMECPGNHVFHLKCIDRWLVKSDKCPMCNCSVFHSIEESQKKKR